MKVSIYSCKSFLNLSYLSSSFFQNQHKQGYEEDVKTKCEITKRVEEYEWVV